MIDTFLECPCPSQLILRTDKAPLSFRLFQEGSKVELSRLEHYFGGGACNTAVSFAKQGLSTTIIAAIGDDVSGKKILQHLNGYGINVNFVSYKDNDQTGVSFIIPCSDADRLALVYRGANNALHVEEVLDGLGVCDAVYLCSLHDQLARDTSVVARAAKEKSQKLICNPGTSQLKRYVQEFSHSLPLVDVLIVNAYEAGILASSLGINSSLLDEDSFDILPELLRMPLPARGCAVLLRDFFSAVHGIGPKIAVVTNGAEGVYVSDGSHILFQASACGQVVSTLGAGDAFGSAFVAALLQKQTLEYCLQAGVVNSAHVLQFLDTQMGLLDSGTLSIALSENGLKPVAVYPI